MNPDHPLLAGQHCLDRSQTPHEAERVCTLLEDGVDYGPENVIARAWVWREQPSTIVQITADN